MQPWKSRKPCMKTQQESRFRLLGGLFRLVPDGFCRLALATCKLDETGSGSPVPGRFRSHLWLSFGTMGRHWGVQDRHQDQWCEPVAVKGSAFMAEAFGYSS